VSPDQPADVRDGPGGAAPGAEDEERIPDPRPRHTPLWALLSGWLLALEAWLRSHGGDRLRSGIRAFWALVAVGGLVLLLGPVINKPMTLDEVLSSSEEVLSRWVARDFDVEYTIVRADDGSLRARVEERIAAFFPEDSDEQGVQRVLATEYQGHALAPSKISATFDGEPVEVAQSSTPTLLTLTVDAGERLRGDHELVLSYELQHLAYEAVDEATGQPVVLLEWDVFGPSWPQGLAALDVRVTLPEEAADRLIRQPRGGAAWLIVGDSTWLEPEPDSPPGQVSYGFELEQNMPPHASAWFSMSFEPGTFAMPPRSPLFWAMSLGPLLPLAVLVATLLLALAARAVAWSDARGRPWFVAQYEPPRGVTPGMAAQLLRSPRTAELAESLRAAQQRGGGKAGIRERRIAAALVARRTGRLGDLPRALARFLAAPERRAQLREGMRRIPRGFVRDLFIAAPIALTLVQWGLVRQLSYQAKLAVVWWPVAFVLLSSAIALVVLGIALTSRPLTRKGALAKQHLKGIGVYAEHTRLLERGPAGDAVLPYAVLMAPPREAGERAAELVEQQLGDPDAARDWRIPDFLTVPRLLIRALALLVVAVPIAMAAVVPSPYDRWHDYQSYWGDLPGTFYSRVDSIDAVAELSRDADGRARLEVVERLGVTFEDDPAQVPQLAQQWPNLVDGQPLGLVVESVRIDGAEVPFVTEQDRDTLLMRTALAEVMTGSHEVRIAYSLASAAVAADGPRASGGGVVDRVRWTALLEGWEYDFSWGGDPPLDPLRLELRLSEELAAEAERAGWITLDTDSAERARDWEDSVVPFGSVPALSDAGASTESSARDDGLRAYALELRHDEHGGYPWSLRVDDVGAMLDFPAGTFAGPDAGALRATRLAAVAPMILTVALAAATVLIAVAGVVALARRRPAAGALRDLLRWPGPAAALGTLILFVWLSIDMAADAAEFPTLGLSALAAIGGGVVAAVLGWRRGAA